MTSIGKFSSIPVISLDDAILARLLAEGETSQAIEGILKPAVVAFSPLSIQNLVTAIQTYRVLRQIQPISFFIYGSTARGDCGIDQKVQEIQVWWKDVFLGSCFRFFGVGDLDQRCIVAESVSPSQIETLETGLRSLKVPESIRIDTLDFVREDLSDRDRSSFYRRMLLFDTPLVLAGKNELEQLACFGEEYVTDLDALYDGQRKEFRREISRALETNPSHALFLSRSELFQHFPVFYSETELAHVNQKRNAAQMIDLGDRESSIVSTWVWNRDSIGSLLSAISKNPTWHACCILESSSVIESHAPHR